MAPRANWKGFLRLSLVTCPVGLYPATSDSEKISFNQINKKAGDRIRYLLVDAESGKEVPSKEITKDYPVLPQDVRKPSSVHGRPRAFVRIVTALPNFSINVVAMALASMVVELHARNTFHERATGQCGCRITPLAVKRL